MNRYDELSFPLDGNSYPTRHNANRNMFAVILCYIFHFVQIVFIFWVWVCFNFHTMHGVPVNVCVWRRGSRYPFAAERQLFSFKLKSLYKCIKSLSVRMEKRTYQRKINWFVYVTFLSQMSNYRVQYQSYYWHVYRSLIAYSFSWSVTISILYNITHA